MKLLEIQKRIQESETRLEKVVKKLKELNSSLESDPNKPDPVKCYPVIVINNIQVVIHLFTAIDSESYKLLKKLSVFINPPSQAILTALDTCEHLNKDSKKMQMDYEKELKEKIRIIRTEFDPAIDSALKKGQSVTFNKLNEECRKKRQEMEQSLKGELEKHIVESQRKKVKLEKQLTEELSEIEFHEPLIELRFNNLIIEFIQAVKMLPEIAPFNKDFLSETYINVRIG
jgi:hypothetical protein